MRSQILMPIVVVLAVSINAVAEAQFRFADMMMSLSGQKEHVVAEVPDRVALANAQTYQQAETIARGQTYEKMLAEETRQVPVELAQIFKLAKKKKLTVVVLPGLFSEFNQVRSFEEIFERDSIEKTKWLQNKVSQSMYDDQYDLDADQMKKAKLSDLMSVGSVDDENGNVLLKLVIMNTKLGSLESMGSIKEKAQIFNRRLQMFLNLTQDQNVVLLGFSRGTPLALEMLSQARQQNLSYLSRVEAMVAYVGVVMGASIADLTNDPSTADGQFFAAVKEFSEGLQTSDSLLDRPRARIQNTMVIGKFLGKLAFQSGFTLDSVLNTARSGDFRTMAMLVGQVVGQLYAKSITDLNGHVIRLKKFATGVLQSVTDLRTESRMTWFKENTLPKNIKYYSISAAMVDPEKSAIEKEIYEKKIGYNGGLDDAALQRNRRTYEKEAGFSLNDAQVAFHQSTFIPKVIESLNPANAGLRTEALGVLQTQHWAVSLKVVNAMKDKQENPFPRENVLVALAAYLNQ